MTLQSIGDKKNCSREYIRQQVSKASKFLKSEFLNFRTFSSSILESFREVIATANLEFVPPISATKVFNGLGPITFDSYV